MRNRIALGVVASLLLLVGGRVGADDGPSVRLEARIDVSAAGDGRARLEIVFGAPMYAAVKGRSPDPRKFLQDLAPDRANYEMTDATARYDDARASVVLDMTERGGARNRGGGRWEMDAEANATLVGIRPGGTGRTTVAFSVEGVWENGVRYSGTYACVAPPGAKDVAWDAGTKVLSWRLDLPAAGGAPRLSADFRARDRLMSTIYKVYGLGTDLQAYWLAKTVFRNDGTGVARNLRVRYRLQGYGDWSPWEKHPEVVPGQTVVSVHYPVIDASIAKIRANTPANVLVEYSYEDEAGKKTEDDAAKKLVILGVNEFVFGNLVAGASFGTWQEEYNNAPLLAAWVSRNDGAVRQFATMANRVAGGVGASQDDASALKVLKACYELLQANDFTYQHPPALTDTSVSFDPKRVQNVKFPRETIRDRSGTCIDLAILYAAMANVLGLEAHLALVPGHCFPVIRLPSGRLAGVETTGIGGGRRTGSAPFDKAQPYADEEFRKAQGDGRIYLLDVRSLWTRGISNPELDELPPDILERWGISEEGRPGPRRPPTEPVAPDPTKGPDATVGVWGGKIEQAAEDRTIDAFFVGIDKVPDGSGYTAGTRAEVTVKGPSGVRKVVVVTYYKGVAKDQAVVFESTERKRTVDGGAPELLAQNFLLAVVRNGRLEARVGNDDEGYTNFTLSPKRDAPTPPEPAPTPAPAPSGLDRLRGSWGGGMAKASLGGNVFLDEMFIDIPARGAWDATVRMNMTVEKDGESIPITILAPYRGGRVDGQAIRWAKVAWHRTVKPTGQETDLDGNPLTLSLSSDGGLAGKFEGTDGFTFTLARRAGGTPPPAPVPPAPVPPAPAPTPTPTPTPTGGVATLAGSWGGSLSDAALNDELMIRDATVDLARKPFGGWTAVVKFTFLVRTPNGNVEVRADGTYVTGKTDGDAVKFGATKLTRTVVSSGERTTIDGNALELRREPDGRIEVKLVGEGGFTLTLVRR